MNLSLAILGGACLSGAFAPISLWWLAPLGIAIHMYTLKRCARPFLNSFIFAFTFNAIALNWTSIFVGSTPWLILALGQALFFIPLGLCRRFSISFYPLIFLVLEQIRSIFPFGGFGWLRIAYSQSDAPYRQIAAIGGAVALSAIVLCVALVLAAVFSKRLLISPILPLFLLMIPVQTHAIGEIKTLMVQGDVPKLGLDFNSRAKAVFANHVAETRKALAVNSDVDFILWPENAVDVDPFTNSDVEKELNSFSQPLIIGAVIRSQGKLQNTSILWTKQSRQIYIKRHLTPFGEYIPLRPLAQKISSLSKSVEDFHPGSSSPSFVIGQAKIAPVICFELVDDGLLSEAASSSHLFVVQTNSATFGISAQSTQQLGISRIRAIEHGRHTLSVSTTGISAVIDHQGTILQSTQSHRPAHLFTTTQLLDSQTPRDWAGDWAQVGSFIWLVFLTSSRHRLRVARR